MSQPLFVRYVLPTGHCVGESRLALVTARKAGDLCDLCVFVNPWADGVGFVGGTHPLQNVPHGLPGAPHTWHVSPNTPADADLKV